MVKGASLLKNQRATCAPGQVDITPGGGTDAGKFHLYHIGVPTMVVSVPARYIHSNVSIVHHDDLDHLINLFFKTRSFFLFVSFKIISINLIKHYSKAI
jgi:putative aminopeptidase FrvX